MAPREPTGRPPSHRLNTAIRWSLLIAAVLLFNILAARGLTALVETRLGAGLSASFLVGLAPLVAYALPLAIPFVPGVEIGISLLIMQGGPVAPLVHGATVAGLSLAYGVGLAFSSRHPCGFLRAIGFPGPAPSSTG